MKDINIVQASMEYALHNDEVIGWCDILPKGNDGIRHVGVLGLGLLPDYGRKGMKLI